MNLIVWSIAGGVNEQNSIANTVCGDDRVAESVIKATNVFSHHHTCMASSIQIELWTIDITFEINHVFCLLL